MPSSTSNSAGSRKVAHCRAESRADGVANAPFTWSRCDDNHIIKISKLKMFFLVSMLVIATYKSLSCPTLFHHLHVLRGHSYVALMLMHVIVAM